MQPHAAALPSPVLWGGGGGEHSTAQRESAEFVVYNVTLMNAAARGGTPLSCFD
jgi:hypothetical protein